jgi:hypothetical protein
MARFQFAIGIVQGRVLAPREWGESTINSGHMLTTTGVPREAVRTLLWWWEGMLNRQGRKKEAAKIQKFRLHNFGGPKRAGRSAGSMFPAAQPGKPVKSGARATVCGRRRRLGSRSAGV